MAKLTVKQEAFALAYLEVGNASEAYRRAYNAGKMTPNSIAVAASRLLNSPKVSLRVDELREEAQKRSGVTVDRILHELAIIAFSDIRDVVTWDEDSVDLTPSQELTRDQAATVREVKATKTTTSGKDDYQQVREQREVKLYDKQRALELLGKHLGMFTDKVEHSGTVTLADIAKAASGHED